jgi:3-methyladenine DNA glycosylase/8-oxoguanine DNA glycosylase
MIIVSSLPPDAQELVQGSFDVQTIARTFMRIDPSDPTSRVRGPRCWLTRRTPEGPATVEMAAGERAVQVRGYGPGAGWAVSRARRLLGADDDPSDFQPDHPLLKEAMRRQPELKFGRTDTIVDNLVPAILGQRVTVRGAAQSWRGLIRRYGDPAPGPEEGLWLSPDPERLGGEAYFHLHKLGIERTRAQVVLEVCRRWRRIEALADEPAPEAARKLTTLRGIGPWTAATLLVSSHGDPDAVPVGDLHLPHGVAWALAGEPRADDARMLELLSPWSGHRARVLRLLRAVPTRPPRYGPPLDTPDIREM